MKRILPFLFFCSLVSAQKVVVYFDFDQSSLNDAAIETLNTLALNGDKIEVAKIYGFCDWKGSNGYNDTLSVRRVNEVYKYLTTKGVKIKPDYIAKGFGEDFEQSKVQAENRKVTVIFEPKRDPAIVPAEDKALTDKVRDSKTGDKIKLQNINFHNNSSVIVPKSKPILYELLCIMEENPTLKIEIQGHICCQTVADVHDVSSARARAIYNFLIRNKINRSRLSYKGFGITNPIYPIPEKSEDEANENRRVEIMIVEK